MLPYCLKCKKSTEDINPKVSKTNNGKTMLSSNFAINDSKKIKIYEGTRSKRTMKQPRS